MKSILKALLQSFIDQLDRDNCNMSSSQIDEVINALSHLNPDLSKQQAYEHLGISRATFDNYVKDGIIPHGYKRDGFKELFWNKYELDSIVLKNPSL